jgi:hypothetical protein
MLPELAGNHVDTTLGNILRNGRAGLLFVDFGTGDFLHLSGRAQVLGGSRVRSPRRGTALLARHARAHRAATRGTAVYFRLRGGVSGNAGDR